MTTRHYSSIDMIRMARMAREYPHLNPIPLMKKFNEEHPPKSAEELNSNLKNALDKIFENQESKDSIK